MARKPEEEPAKEVGEQTGGISPKTARQIDIETGEIRGPRVTLEGGRLTEREDNAKLVGGKITEQTGILMNAPDARVGKTTSSKIFINLPVKNLNKSIQFFRHIGFGFEPKFTDANATCMIIGDNIFAMLLATEFFRSFTVKQISDPTKTTEVLISLLMKSREEVNEIVRLAVEAGGTTYAEPRDDGWMYGWSFADLDGHQWELLFMDESRMPPSPIEPKIEPSEPENVPTPTETNPPMPDEVKEFSKKANY